MRALVGGLRFIVEAKRLNGTGVIPPVRIHSPWSGHGSPSHVATAKEGTDLEDLRGEVDSRLKKNDEDDDENLQSEHRRLRQFIESFE